LGRIADDGMPREMAARICEQKPKGIEAIRVIRRWRTGKAPLGDAHGLPRA
jgi:hypothetical protein